ncbi:YtxH domain-containing protein, partial [Candidatus Pacearchaeota archaeon]|nr:YtxH domain-containing protein [Candidatus Pacearchaeota archaeon]
MKIGRYIVGLVSGLTFGMLFAPKTGKKLRKELKKTCTDPSKCHEGAKVLGKAFKEAGEEVWDELKEFGDHEQVAAF